MVFTDNTRKYFSLLQHRIRSAMAHYQYIVPFKYDDEPFFKTYEALGKNWVTRQSQRKSSQVHRIRRNKLKKYEVDLENYATV